MPTYDYKCDNCGHIFEHFQSITSKPLVKCPQCEKRKLKRLIGAGAGLIFKGSGFYQTDYRSDGYKSSAGKETSSPKPASDKSASTDTAKAEKPKSEPAKTEPAKSGDSTSKPAKKTA